jgi:formiminotetrahydrofolate cyclodeaminase
MTACKLPQGDAQERKTRDDAIQKATRGAAEVPLGVAERAVALLERLKQLETIAAASMKSDLEVARWMALAGANGALANVEINLDGLKDSGYVTAAREKIAAFRSKLVKLSSAQSGAN